MHNDQPVLSQPTPHERICDRAFGLVALGYMLTHFHPFDSPRISEQDMTFNLQRYGTLIHDLSQGIFADIDDIERSTGELQGEDHEASIS